MNPAADTEAFIAAQASMPDRAHRVEYPGLVEYYGDDLIAWVRLDDGNVVYATSEVGPLAAGAKVAVAFEKPRKVTVVGIYAAPDGSSGVSPWVRMAGVSPTSVPEATLTIIPWSSVVEAGGGFPGSDWWTAGDFISCPIPGVYMAFWSGTWQAAANGYREIALITPIGNVIRDERAGTASSATQCHGAIPVTVNAGQQFGIRAFYQSSGAAASLNVTAAQLRLVYMHPRS